MKPILYAANETAFTSKGLGTLYDAISCTVEEERNGKYELQMEYPVGGQHFEDIAHSRFIYAKPADNSDPQPFSIYAISKPINGMCTINAEHISYRLTNIPVVPPIESTSPADALQELKTKAAETCPFTFWTDKTSSGTFTVKEPKSIRSLLAGTEGSILDSFGGGEYQWDKFSVKLYQQRGSDNGVTLKYGKNITDLKQEENIQNTLTGVMPYWYKVDEVDGETEETLVLLSERVVHSSNSANFPYYRTAILDCSSQFKEQPTQAQLRTFAQNYVNTSGFGVPEVSITVQFLPLWQSEEYAGLANLEHVNLCDTVTVEFEPLGVSATAKVIRTKYNVLTERYDEIELGDAKRSLSTSIRSDIDAAKADAQRTARADAQNATNAMASVLRQEMEEAIAQIQTGDDGNIVFTYNSDNERTQILAMDTADISTAQKILLINYQGIGGFNNGISDPSGYHLAITTDGQVKAEAITAGTITAALVMGNTFRIGGTESGDGLIRVMDATGHTIITIDKNGLHGFNASNKEITTVNGDGLTMTAGSIKVTTTPTAQYATYDSTYGSISWSDYPGFTAINYGSGNVVNTQYALFPVSNRVHEQAYGRYWQKDIILKTAGEPGYGTDGILYSFLVNSSGFKFARAYWEDQGYRMALTSSGGILFNTPSLKMWLTSSELTIGANTNTGTQRLKITDSAGYINGNTVAYQSSSSKRYKHGINHALTGERDPHRLLELHVVEFVFNDDHMLQYADMADKTLPGFIAEEVDEIYPSATIHDPDTGLIENWDERRIIPGMLALIQEQAKKIEELENRIAVLEGRQ